MNMYIFRRIYHVYYLCYFCRSLFVYTQADENACTCSFHPLLMFVEGFKKNIGSDFISFPWPHFWPQLRSYAVFPNCRATFFTRGWESRHRKSTCLDMCFSCYLTRFALVHTRGYLSLLSTYNSCFWKVDFYLLILLACYLIWCIHFQFQCYLI